SARATCFQIILITTFSKRRARVAGLISFMRTRSARSCTLEIRKLTTVLEGSGMIDTGRTGPIIVFLISLLINACGHSQPPTNRTSTAASPQSTAAPSPSPQTEFEKDMQFIRNGGYTYVYVFSRKDGKPFDSKDSDYLRANAPQIVDMAKTDGGKKFIG